MLWQTNQVRVASLACAIPKAKVDVSELSDLFGSGPVRKISISTGVQSFRIAPVDMCTSDLCFAAAEEALKGHERSEIDALLFVSQTPDYKLPATACILQKRLGLGNSVAALDINLGCSGYVYGLWLASTMIDSGACRNVLLLVGDTISKVRSEEDRSVALLFGDAGSATVLTRDSAAKTSSFSLGTDGSGYDSIILRSGQSRRPSSAEDLIRSGDEGSRRAQSELEMQGAEVYEFTQSTIPEKLLDFLSDSNKSSQDISLFVPHQANKFMLNLLAGKVSIPQEKLLVALKEFGNTSSASIPLALVTERSSIKNNLDQTLLAGFGVGLSWGFGLLSFENTVIHKVIEI